MENLLNWFGGKKNLLKHLYPFPKHQTYVDVFGGGGTVLLFKVPSAVEIYNDLNNNLVNLFTVVRDKQKEFTEQSEYLCPFDSRGIFQFLKQEIQKPELNDLERAVYFYYIHRHSFSGMGSEFHGLIGDGMANHHTSYLKKLKIDMKEISQRLQKVQFENQDFKKLLKREFLHQEETLIYLDPPYFQGGENYEKMSGGIEWHDDFFSTMRDLIIDTPAKVCLSIDCTHENLSLGSRWNSTKIERVNSCTSGKTKSRAFEYVIRNYDQDLIKPQSQFKTLDDFKN
jgi:DNA adenine methylase